MGGLTFLAPVANQGPKPHPGGTDIDATARLSSPPGPLTQGRVHQNSIVELGRCSAQTTASICSKLPACSGTFRHKLGDRALVQRLMSRITRVDQCSCNCGSAHNSTEPLKSGHNAVSHPTWAGCQPLNCKHRQAFLSKGKLPPSAPEAQDRHGPSLRDVCRG